MKVIDEETINRMFLKERETHRDKVLTFEFLLESKMIRSCLQLRAKKHLAATVITEFE